MGFDLGQCGRFDEWANFGVRVGGRADGEVTDSLGETLSEGVVDAVVDVEAVGAYAGLPAVAELRLDGAFKLAARNIPNIDVLPNAGLNVYDVLRRDTLVLTRAAVEAIQARFAEKEAA